MWIAAVSDVTLVAHDLGGPAGFLTASRRADRFAALVSVNCFAWRPTGPRSEACSHYGQRTRARIDARSAGFHVSLQPLSVSAVTGADRSGGFSGGIDLAARRAWHGYFRDARDADDLYTELDAGLPALLADRPLLTIFGQFNDPLRFQRRWRRYTPTPAR